MNEIKAGYRNKLKNKIYGLLCEYERNAQWEKFLDSILTELIGFNEEDKTIDYYIIFYKLSASRYFNHTYFRKAIFDSMALLDRGEVKNDLL